MSLFTEEIAWRNFCFGGRICGGEEDRYILAPASTQQCHRPSLPFMAPLADFAKSLDVVFVCFRAFFPMNVTVASCDTVKVYVGS